MAQKFLTDIEVTQGLVDSSGDLGVAGQVLSSTGTATNWITNEANSTVVYQDGFTGDNSTVDFTLSVSVTDENITQVYLDGVYQHKDTYSVSNTTLTFSTAPPLNADIEVITFSTATTADDLQAGVMIIPVKNTHTASIAKGEPVYITGNVGSSARLQIAPADASNSAKMPAAGLLLTTLAVNAEGYVVTGGYLRNITTDTIDSTSTSSNDTVYVKSGGGLTMTKPTGTNLIQNIAKVARVASGNAGSLIVSSILRTNDVPNLTTGKIWVGSANNTIESGTLHLDESNNRLGIGTTSPDGVFKAVYGTSPNAAQILIGYNNTSENYFDANTQIFRNGSYAEKMRLDSSGNLGIGTTSPSQKLHVVGTIYTNTGNFKIDSGYELSWGNGNTSILGNTATGYLDFRTSNGTKMYIDSSGNVGIGTTTPGTFYPGNHNLVVGDGNADSAITVYANPSNTSYLLFADGTSGSSSYTAQVRYNHSTNHMEFATNNSTAAKMTLDDNGNLGIGTTSPSEKLVVQDGKILAGHTNSRGYGFHDLSNYSYTANTGRLSLVSNGIEAISIDSSQNVGIGETSPSGKLHIKGSDTGATPSAQGNSLVLEDSENGLSILSSTAGAGYINFGDSDDNNIGMIIYDHSSNSMRTWVNAVERMRIDSSGNVSIGTTNAVNSKLYVANAGVANLIIGYNNTSNNYFDADTQIFRNSSAVERMRIDSSGNLGIGETSLSTKFTVNALGTASNNDTPLTVSTIRGGVTSNVRNTELLIQSTRSDTGGNRNIILKSQDVGGTSRNLILDASAVGIGTTSPSTVLDVNGDITIGNNASIKSIGSIRIDIDEDNDSTGRAFLVRNDGGTNTLFKIQEDGRVGIGNTSPSAPLTVGNYLSTHHQNHSSLPTVPGNHLVNLTPPSTTNYYGGGISWSEGSNTAASIGVYDAGSGGALGMYFATGNNTTLTERMRIDSSGRVGINVTPTYSNVPLHTKKLGGNDAYNIFEGDSAWVFGEVDYSGTKACQVAGRYGNHSGINVSTSGNVGIGNTSPGTKLEIQVSTNQNILRGHFGQSADIFLGFDQTNPRLLLQDNSNVTTHLFQSNASNYIVNSNVGIGVTNPSFKTHFRGGSNTEETVLKIDKSSYSDTGGHTTILGFGNEPAGWAKGGIGYERTGSYDRGKIHFLQENTGNTDTVTLSDSVMTITPEGYVGIGTSSPAQKLEVIGNVSLGLSSTTTRTALLPNTFGYSTAWKTLTIGSTGTNYQTDAVSLCFNVMLNQNSSGSYTGDGSELFFRNVAYFKTPNSSNNGYLNPLTFNNGNVGIGTTSPGYMLHVQSNSSSTSAAFFRPNVIGTGDPAEPTTVYIDGQKAPALDINRFYSHGTILNIRQNNSNVGSISVTGVATSYNTSSDYRLKENVVEMTGALDRVNQLKPSRFNFISDADIIVDGFLAHEVSDIVPEAITGEKDAIDAEGNPVYQVIDQSKLVPLLVGAIKELKAEIETLKNQINGIN